MPPAAASLTCPDPAHCPVVPALPVDAMRLAQIDGATPLYRCYDGTWGYDEFNPGYGDARFSPFGNDRETPVPVLYAAQTPEGALLETVFHDVHNSVDRIIYESSLRRQLLAHVETPAHMTVVDLRDAELDRLRLSRSQVVSSSQEHYACTRRLVRQVHAATFPGGVLPDGILWHSRQAELSGTVAEVVVVFGDRYGHGRGTWRRIGPGSRNLWEGAGRRQVDSIAEALGALVVTG